MSREQLVEIEIAIANYSVIFSFIHIGQTSESAPASRRGNKILEWQGWLTTAHSSFRLVIK